MDRERITISIRKTVLELVDQTIDGTNIRNRSHGIESMIIQSAGRHNSKNAVILLGGDDALKSIPPTKFFLKRLSEAGFPKAQIAVGFLGDKVKANLGDGADFGIALEYSSKGEGSGGAVSQYKKQFKSAFIVLNSGVELDVDFNALLEYHKSHSAVATLVTNNMSSFEGIYILEPEVFNLIPRGFSMLEEEVFPKLIKEGKAVVWPIG